MVGGRRSPDLARPSPGQVGTFATADAHALCLTGNPAERALLEQRLTGVTL
jgi:hypothetical protein